MQASTTQPVAQRVLIDMDRCIECGSCAAACYTSHANYAIVSFARCGAALLPVICRQCKDASCVAACPVEAMVLDDHGVVRRQMLRCIGCGSCARACPFGVLPSEPTGEPRGFRSGDRISGHQMAKCDLCEDRLQAGLNTPRCVAACPSGALLFADEHQAAEQGFCVLGGRTTGEDLFKRR